MGKMPMPHHTHGADVGLSATERCQIQLLSPWSRETPACKGSRFGEIRGIQGALELRSSFGVWLDTPTINLTKEEKLND